MINTPNVRWCSPWPRPSSKPSSPSLHRHARTCRHDRTRSNHRRMQCRRGAAPRAPRGVSSTTEQRDAVDGNRSHRARTASTISPDTVAAVEFARMSPVRRSLAGLLFGLAAIVGSIARQWLVWLQRIAFYPDAHARRGRAPCSPDNGHQERGDQIIADATAAQLPDDAPVELQQVPRRHRPAPSAGRRVPGDDRLHEAHARLIGERDEPVRDHRRADGRDRPRRRAADVPTITSRCRGHGRCQ